MTSRVDCGCFCCLFFFPFHPSTLIACKSNFVVFLDFLCMDLSRSHYLSCEITRVVSSSIFFPFFNLIFFYFHPSILSWFGIDFSNLFWFSFHRVITISWHGLQIWPVNQDGSNISLSQYFKKNILQYVIVSIFFKKYYPIYILQNMLATLAYFFLC